MSKWVGQFTCPGYMFVPHKPWTCGNEYHTIACGEMEIIYGLYLVEGRDSVCQGPKKFNVEYRKTAGLLLRLCEPIFGTCHVVVLDSGFCVLEAILELAKKGVFASALVKK